MGTIRKIGDQAYGVTSLEQLFDLIKQRTKEGKIIWKGAHYKLEGTIPGTGMRLLLEFHSDQRDGDWHTLQLTVNGNSVNLGSESELAALRKYISEKPSNDAMAEAREILENM